MSIARQMVKSAMSTALPRSRFLLNGPPGEIPADKEAPQEIALTFDDGPHPTWTPTVLDELSRVGWKGTFFVVGDRVEEHPHLVQRIVGEGHRLGNHTYSHSSPDATSANTFLEEVRRTHDVIHDITGISTSLMRPPLGKLNWGKFRGLWSAQQSIVLWNTDPKDFSMQNEAEAVEWSQSYHPRTGDIVLLHDRLPYAAQIVRALSQRWGEALRSVPVSDWIDTSRLDGHQPGPTSWVNRLPQATAEVSR